MIRTLSVNNHQEHFKLLRLRCFRLQVIFKLIFSRQYTRNARRYLQITTLSQCRAVSNSPIRYIWFVNLYFNSIDFRTLPNRFMKRTLFVSFQNHAVVAQKTIHLP